MRTCMFKLLYLNVLYCKIISDSTKRLNDKLNVTFLLSHTYMTRTENTVRSSRRDAGVIGRPAVAGWASPARITDTLTTYASAMIRAELTLITIARKIVALAKISRYFL